MRLAVILPASLWLLMLAGIARSIAMGAPSDDAAPVFTVADAWALARTIGVSLAIAMLATALGLPGAWALRRLGSSGAAMLVAPVLLPSYAVYAAWSIARAPGTWLGDRLEGSTSDAWKLVALAQAIGGLALWSSPLASLVLSRAIGAIDPAALDALRMEPASIGRRALTFGAMLRPGLLVSIAVIAALTMGSAVPLHLAQVETSAISVWRTLIESGGGARPWLSAAPLMAMLGIISWFLARATIRQRGSESGAGASRDAGVKPRWVVSAIVVWLASALVPGVLLATQIGSPVDLARFWVNSDQAALGSLWPALAAGFGGIIVAAIGVRAGGRSARGATRGAAFAQFLWIALALMPGVLVGGAVAALGSLPFMGLLIDSWAGLALAHVMRFGAVGALLGWWAGAARSVEQTDAQALFGSGSWRAWWAAQGPTQGMIVLGAGAATALLSVHEIEAAVVVAPPNNLAHHLLNLLHGLRDRELSAACISMLLVGTVIATLSLIPAARLMRASRPLAVVLLALGALMAVPACEELATPGAGPIRGATVIGEVGNRPGHFVYPRVIEADGESFYVIDKTGRVQRFDPEGNLLAWWDMPHVDRGRPTGMACGRDGLVYIADTHEHRVSIFRVTDVKSEMVGHWGEYGDGPGQFVLVRDVAIRHDANNQPERFYVSEDGGVDRISVFDSAHQFLFSFGTSGSSESPDEIGFRRAQGLLFDEMRARLFVADAGNHRVGVFTPEGQLVRWIGAPGATPGNGPSQFSYPYGLALLGDGTLLVSEYGGNRVQRIDPDTGESLGVYGTAGRGEGELAYPWGVAVLKGRALVIDAGNNRVLSFVAGTAASGLSPEQTP